MNKARFHSEIERVADRKVEEKGAYDLQIGSIASIDSTTRNPILSIKSTHTKPDRCAVSYDGIFHQAVAGDSAMVGYTPDGRRAPLGHLTDQPLITGHYKLFPADYIASESDSGFGTANQVRVMRVLWDRAVKISRIMLWCATATGGSKGGVAIYSADGNERLITTGAQALTAVQVLNVDVTDKLINAGWVYVAWTLNDTSATITCAPAFSANALAVLNATTVQVGTAANAASDGAPPATLGTITGASFPLPIIKFQA
jgi:hypothetical protein